MIIEEKMTRSKRAPLVNRESNFALALIAAIFCGYVRNAVNKIDQIMNIGMKLVMSFSMSIDLTSSSFEIFTSPIEVV